MTCRLIVVLIGIASAAIAQDNAEFEVERQESREIRSLDFLRENQVFLRAQLDRLRTRVHWREFDAHELSTRQQWLRGLATELDAAEDSLARERDELARRDLLRRIEDLAAIEHRLDHLQSLLDDQDARLRAIERDYVGRQETALAVLARGLPVDDARALVIRTLDGDPVRVDLDAAAREALHQDALATLLHDFVEPRTHELELFAVDADGHEIGLGRVTVTARRDRLTFVEIDLDERAEDGTLTTTTWTR